MTRNVACLLTYLVPTAGCGYASYDVLGQGVDASQGVDAGDAGASDAGDAGASDAGDLGPTDAGVFTPVRFSDLCNANMATVIHDGDFTDDGIGDRLGVAVSAACGPGFSVRTVDQTDVGILSPIDSRPLLGPDDLALVGGYSLHANVMVYLEPRFTPVTWSRTATDYVLRDRATNSLLRAEPLASIDAAHDIGIVQVTLEPLGGTIVLNVFGAQNRGALAAAYYFEQQIAPSLATDTRSYYVVRWTNADGNANPSAGDAYTVITTP